MKLDKTYLLCVASLLVATSAGASAGSAAHTARPHLEAPALSMFGRAGRIEVLAVRPRSLAGASWWGGTYDLGNGEKVSLYISGSYPRAEAVAKQWVDFFAGLVHGPEISSLRAYIAPLEEVHEMCFSDQALGCYGSQKLVTMGDSSSTGVSPASIAAHEYGHHIAANRSNAPWIALDWGTKRWASQTGICWRVQAGTVFPGDEGVNYSFNPGEAFAESYRVLIETNGSALGYDWPIVDPSFRPDSRNLEAVRDDVLHPWSGSTTKTIPGKFLRRSRTWTSQVATPLDGDLRVRVTVPGGGANDVALLSSDGRTVLAKSSWDSSGAKSIEYRVCGVRSVKVRVIRGGRPARFSLRVTTP